jgi:transcription elongation factor Elf1
MMYETCPRCGEPISVLGHPVGVRVLTCDDCGARWAAHPRGKLQRLDDVRVDDIERMDE